MADVSLVVRYGRQVVARMLVEDGRFGIAYEPAWIAADVRFPISISLPVREEPYIGGAAHAFFANLLPEGAARQAVCSRLGISVDNDLALLRAIGGECAGALSVTEPDRPLPDPDDYSYEVIDERRLQKLVGDDVVPLLLGGPPTRLSLAGAQDKLPVAVFDGEIHLPLEGAPSTHILKLPNARYAHLTLNEAFVMGLAARAGLEVAPCELVTKTDPPSLLVQRYDRILGRHHEVSRLHQEDLCQALGLPPTQKYEQEGGPSLATAIGVVQDNVREPVLSIRRLIEWQAFNVVAGNCDGHAKNLALVYEGARLRLAPFYDLVSTRHYPALDRRLAMAVGGRREPTQLHRAQWEQLARDVQVAPRLATEIVTEVAERTLAAVPGWVKDYRARYGRRAILETLPTQITRAGKRLLRELRPG